MRLYELSGQVGGVAFASAIFQFKLDAELHARINGPNAEEVGIEFEDASLLK
jgi:hypothetical protein